jgi:hypothetical protein
MATSESTKAVALAAAEAAAELTRDDPSTTCVIVVAGVATEGEHDHLVVLSCANEQQTTELLEMAARCQRGDAGELEEHLEIDDPKAVT